MREVRYKAFLTTSQKMFDVYALTFDMNGDLENVLLRTGENGSTTVPLLVVHLLQYTGLKDKNGDEIYEGDVVDWKQGEPSNYEIQFIEGAFVLMRPELKGFPIEMPILYPSYGCQIEVLGNIYETPELLTNPKLGQ